MNKADILIAVCNETTLQKTDVEAAYNAVFRHLGAALARGEEVKIHGFGTFSISRRNARVGRNPRTGETIEVPAARVAKWQPSKTLKTSINA